MTKFDYFTAVIAKRLVLFAAKINAAAVMSLCLETSRIYRDKYPENENNRRGVRAV